MLNSIYRARYVCRAVQPIGLPGYNDVVLGLNSGNGSSDITIKGTLSRFVVGREYLIDVMELS
jgi:hypothetical protein